MDEEKAKIYDGYFAEDIPGGAQLQRKYGRFAGISEGNLRTGPAGEDMPDAPEDSNGGSDVKDSAIKSTALQ